MSGLFQSCNLFLEPSPKMIRQDNYDATRNAAIITEDGQSFITTEDGQILQTE